MPTPNTFSASIDANPNSAMLISSAAMPKLTTVTGMASTWITGFIEALISAIKRANAAYARSLFPPTAWIPGRSQHMIPQAIVITNQLIRNLFMITSIGVIMHLRTRTYHICPFRQTGLRSCFGSSGIAYRRAMEKQRLASGSRAVRGCGGRCNDRRVR